jgi:glycerol-3-phosphate dehydrogenase
MAADVMQAIRKAQLVSLTSEDVTLNTKMCSATASASPYGTDAELLASLPGADLGLGPLPSQQLSEAMVRFAARYEYARTVEDVLARRNRLLFLDASAALAVAPQVAEILSTETGVSPQLEAFEALAKSYQMP